MPWTPHAPLLLLQKDMLHQEQVGPARLWDQQGASKLWWNNVPVKDHNTIKGLSNVKRSNNRRFTQANERMSWLRGDLAELG